jgi:beta-mannosidase
VFPGTVTEATYRSLLEMVRESNMNLMRCWGGGFVNKESFFDLCDEMGIMVWQVFTRACHRYEDEPDYLKVLDQESRAIITRLRPHASLALWCGGNEMFNNWSKNDDQQLHVRLTARNCFDLDPSRPYLNTSPVMGIGHGGYWFQSDDGQNVFTAYTHANRTAYCEFGVPATPSAEKLRSFIPAGELFPPQWGTAWQTHFGFNAWANEKQAWLKPAIIEKYLGASETLEDLVYKSQLMQSAGLKVVFEEARRQKPRCSIVLNWCLNEPYPNAANNSIVAWPAERKPALKAVAQSLRQTVPSARVMKFDWAAGEEFEAELWMLNDRLETIDGGTVRADLIIADASNPLGIWDFPALAPNRNAHGPTLRLRLPELRCPTFKLVLQVIGRPDLANEYVFAKKLK